MNRLLVAICILAVLVGFGIGKCAHAEEWDQFEKDAQRVVDSIDSNNPPAWYFVLEKKEICNSDFWERMNRTTLEYIPPTVTKWVVVFEGEWSDVGEYLNKNYAEYSYPFVWKVDRVPVECDVIEHKKVREVEEVTKSYRWRVK